MITKVEQHHSSRLTNINCSIDNIQLQIINVYAHSGSKLKAQREKLFSDELIYYMQNNIDNLLLLGDFNCILSEKDSSSHVPYLYSSSLHKICKDLKLCDAHNILNKGLPQYTYIKKGYGSRIDKIYVNSLKNHISKFETISVAFSDHNAVKLNVELVNVNRINKYCYWKLNVSILENEDIDDLFRLSWDSLKKCKYKFSSVLEWWDYSKSQIAILFKRIGKELNSQKYGLLNYLEEQLKYFNHIHQTNPANGFTEITNIKARINNIKSTTYEGVRIRARIDW